MIEQVHSVPVRRNRAESERKKMVRFRQCVTMRNIFIGIAVLAFVGCGTASVNTTKRTEKPLPKPDKVVVHNFAVSAAEVTLDEGAMATAVRNSKNRDISDEEQRIGHAVADRLSSALVDELQGQGIPATRAGKSVKVSPTTLELTGQFLTIDEGNQTARVWLGFGMGGTDLRTRVQAWQNKKMVAEGETVAKSGLKPGMLTSLGVGAAASTAVPVVAGAATTGFSETLTATVEADAKRTAKEVAKRVKKAYQERGWMQ